MTAAQRRQLVRLLLRGPLAAGYLTDLWTTARIAEVIRRQFHVRYHPDHVGRLLHAMNWSSQKPESRALERDEAAIAAWKAREWPRAKRTPRGQALDRLHARCPRLHVERLPAYAPELNPDEGVWTVAKHALANNRPDAIPTLARRLRGSLQRVLGSQRLLRGCFAQSDLPPFFP